MTKYERYCALGVSSLEGPHQIKVIDMGTDEAEEGSSNAVGRAWLPGKVGEGKSLEAILALTGVSF